MQKGKTPMQNTGVTLIIPMGPATRSSVPAVNSNQLQT
jgi:hypothetical protein